MYNVNALYCRGFARLKRREYLIFHMTDAVTCNMVANYRAVKYI